VIALRGLMQENGDFTMDFGTKNVKKYGAIKGGIFR